MLGGGNPVSGANPAGTGSVLNYIGNRVYAYGGQLPNVSSYTTGLKFDTGPELIVGKLQFDSMCSISNLAGGDNCLFKVSINNEPVSITKMDGAQEDMPAVVDIPLVLAPFTQVKIEYQGSTDSADFTTFMRFTGKVL